MGDAEIIARLTEVVEDAVDASDLALTPSSRADDVVGWDSLAHVRILVGLEEAFGIRFGAGEIAELRNVGDLVAAIKGHIAAS